MFSLNFKYLWIRKCDLIVRIHYLECRSVCLPEVDVDGSEHVASDRGVEIGVPGDQHVRLAHQMDRYPKHYLDLQGWWVAEVYSGTNAYALGIKCIVIQNTI